MVFAIVRQAYCWTEEFLRFLLVYIAIASVWALGTLQRCNSNTVQVCKQYWQGAFYRRQKVCLEDCESQSSKKQIDLQFNICEGLDNYCNKEVEHINYEISDKDSVISSVDESLSAEINVTFDSRKCQGEVLQKMESSTWVENKKTEDKNFVQQSFAQIETSADKTLLPNYNQTTKQVKCESELLPQKTIFEMQNKHEMQHVNKDESVSNQDALAPQQKLSKSKKRRNRSKRAKQNRANNINQESKLNSVEPSCKTQCNNNSSSNKNANNVLNVPSSVGSFCQVAPAAGEVPKSPSNPPKKSRKSRKSRNQCNLNMHTTQNITVQTQQDFFCEQNYCQSRCQNFVRPMDNTEMQDMKEMSDLLDHIEVVRFKSAVDPSAIEWYESNLPLISSIDVRLLVRKLHGNSE